jgi:hypothetical protein
MIIVGALMEIVLPMMQYLIWMGAIAGIMIFAVEAVVGSAFWAFAHVRADGQELVNQQQAYGYSILMNAIFRPLLTVVGLVFSSVIMAVLAQFVDATFAMAFSNSGVGSIYDPVSIITIFMLLLYVHYQVAVRSLSVITILPDAILRWIGSGTESSSYGALKGEEMGTGFHGAFLSTGKNSLAFRGPPDKNTGGGQQKPGGTTPSTGGNTPAGGETPPPDGGGAGGGE